jgi:transcriptional regulator with XRE-family HTH domain
MLAHLLRTRMQELGFTPLTLAAATGLTPSAISRLLTGSRFNPEAKTVNALATALRLSADAIVDAAVADQDRATTEAVA